MKLRFIPILLAFLAINGTSLFSQEKLPILINNTPFALIDDLDNDITKYTDLSILKKDWPAYPLPKGLVVEVLGCESYDAMLKVKLPDGSLGYIPTVAVALNDISFVLDQEYSYGSFNKKKTFPKGSYKLLSVGRLEYMKKLDWKHSVQPQYFIFQHESGKKFKIELDRISTSGGDLASRFMRYDGPGIYNNFFVNHPGVKKSLDLNVLRFKLKDGELPVTLLGYSRSYIESVLGSPFSYAGYSITPYDGYTYACHTNVAWDTEENKKRDDSGLLIYYDKNQIAVYMDKCPIDYYYDSFFTKLYTPKKALVPMDPNIAHTIESSRRGGAPVYRANGEEHIEKYTEPKGFYKLWVKAIYGIEYTLGIHNRWAILGLLIGLNFVMSLLICVIVRYILPFSNENLKIISYALNVPMSLFVVIYISRFYIMAAILAGIAAIGFAQLGASLLFNTIDSSRCDKCRRWLKQPILLREEEGAVQVSDPSVTMFTGITVGTASSTEYRYGAKISHFSRGMNFKSTVKLTTPIKQYLKCPFCGYEWTFMRYSMEEVPGPICFSDETKSTKTYRETEITNRQIRDKSTGQILHEEEVGRRDVQKSVSMPSSSSSSYDIKRYNEYLRRYLNGDKSALLEYQRRYWGDYYGG